MLVAFSNHLVRWYKASWMWKHWSLLLGYLLGWYLRDTNANAEMYFQICIRKWYVRVELSWTKIWNRSGNGCIKGICTSPVLQQVPKYGFSNILLLLVNYLVHWYKDVQSHHTIDIVPKYDCFGTCIALWNTSGTSILLTTYCLSTSIVYNVLLVLN